MRTPDTISPDTTRLTDGFWSSAALVFLVAIAVYHKALWFAPTGDDLRILSSVSQTSNPLSYFAGDWGMENTYLLTTGETDTARRTYRPLHSLGIWLGYRAFGVWAFPNQLLNLLLHAANALLLLRIIRRLGLDSVPAFLLAFLGLISLYTASPATWVSDRQTLVVGMAVLVLMDHLLGDDGRLRRTLNPWLIAGLTIVAVLFKESGLIIPVVAGAFIVLSPYEGPKKTHLSICILLVACYMALRLWLFGANAFTYHAEGFVFGNQYYINLRDLPWGVRLWARFETVAKNFVSVFLPIFNSVGRLDETGELVRRAAWWLPTTLLAIAATRRPLTAVQWLALAVVAANSAVHMQVFRFRVEYVSQMAFCIYVAASPIWQRKGTWVSLTRRPLALGCVGLLVFVTAAQVNRSIDASGIERRDEVITRRLAPVTRKYPISPRVTQQVLTLYAPSSLEITE
jgi:hypothetical protein